MAIAKAIFQIKFYLWKIYFRALIIKILSLLPLRVLYVFSDLLYFLSFWAFKYRKKVIEENLRLAFPEKSNDEIQQLVVRFYRHLTDLLVEVIKTLSLSEKELARRVHFSNLELPLGYLRSGKSVIVLAGHLCNWEWLLSACMIKGKYPIDAVYKPLSNQFSDKFMLSIRSKFGANPIAMKDTLRDQVKKKNIPHGLAMVADQSPMKSEIQYWTTFFNQDTPYYVGADKISKMLNMPVLFIGMKKIKRGHYEAFFKEIGIDDSDKNEFAITEAYNKILEEEIRKQPENWLWSHRRWKHKREF